MVSMFPMETPHTPNIEQYMKRTYVAQFDRSLVSKATCTQYKKNIMNQFQAYR
jgi:hypothetical protein